VQEKQRQKALRNGNEDEALNVLLALENKGTSQFALPPIDESGGM